MPPFSLPAPGSLAVVTGVSAGIGRGFAVALARGGHPVLAISRRAGPWASEFFAASATSTRRRKPAHELTVEACVDDAIAGALRGRAVVIPGARNRTTALSTRLAPRGVVRRIAARSGLVYLGMDPMPPRRGSGRRPDR